jgi:hypothetical protein
MQMAQTQMAMAGNPMAGNPMYGQMMPGQMTAGQTSNQMAMSPNMNQGMMSAQYAPSGWQQAPSQMPAPTSWASFGTSAPQMNQSADTMPWSAESTMPAEATFDLKSTPSPATAISPTPDPAFSAAATSTPATQISWTQSSTPATATTNNEAPLVDAF